MRKIYEGRPFFCKRADERWEDLKYGSTFFSLFCMVEDGKVVFISQHRVLFEVNHLQKKGGV